MKSIKYYVLSDREEEELNKQIKREEEWLKFDNKPQMSHNQKKKFRAHFINRRRHQLEDRLEYQEILKRFYSGELLGFNK